MSKTMAKVIRAGGKHKKLKQILRSLEAKKQVLIGRKGEPVGILLGLSEYNSLIATLEEMSDPGALKALKEAQEDSRAGKVHSYEEVFGRPPEQKESPESI